MVQTGGSSWHETNRGVSCYFAVYLVLFLLVIFLSKKLHDAPKLASYVPEAAMIILVGIVAGCVSTALTPMQPTDYSHYYDNNNNEQDQQQDQVAAFEDTMAASILSFSPTIFFCILLPPIIFNSGFHINRDLFFGNIKIISLYAITGTCLAAVLMAAMLYAFKFVFTDADFAPTFLELLTYGALISATDPVSTLAVFQSKKVDPRLFYIVFGESVLNDAVGLVLFESLAHLVEIEVSSDTHPDFGSELLQFVFDFVLGFVGSMILGITTGLLYAKFFKEIDMRSTPLLELCLYLPILYVPFCLAELAHLSGIVTVLFAGIAARRYVEPNLSLPTAQNATVLFRVAAHVTETLIFLELGLSVPVLLGQPHHFYGSFVAISLICCLLSRAGNIYPITGLYNLCVRQDSHKIPAKTAHMVWFSGLRGAVSYALSRTFPGPHQEVFVTTTMVVVLLTTFVLGGTTENALEVLDIPTQVDEVAYLKEQSERHGHKGHLLNDRRLHAFESVDIRRWAIRDFCKTKESIKLAEEGYVMETDDAAIEMTERDYQAVVSRNTTSVYDFGKNVPEQPTSPSKGDLVDGASC